MKYNELLEMMIENWNGKPFEAFVTDNPLNDFNPDAPTNKITGWNKDGWIDEDGIFWTKVYPVEWNANRVNKSKRMTNRELEAKQPKWISVKDMLPFCNGRYLVYIKGHQGIGCEQQVLYFNGHYFGTEDNLDIEDMFTEVTHWMSLPEAPKE